MDEHRLFDPPGQSDDRRPDQRPPARKLRRVVRRDAGANYDFNERLSAGISIENLLDKTYYVAADQGGLGGGTVSVGNRRLVQATLGYKF